MAVHRLKVRRQALAALEEVARVKQEVLTQYQEPQILVVVVEAVEILQM